jgi:hypothetical protein
VGVGHEAKSKYIYILGNTPDGYTHFFLISSQDYSKTPMARETVSLPKGSCSGLPLACWIQCFYVVEIRPTLDICSGINFGQILPKGHISEAIAKSVCETVAKSYILKLSEIDETLSLCL